MASSRTCTDTFGFSEQPIFEQIRRTLPDDRSRTLNIVECKDDMVYAWSASNCCILAWNWRVAKTKNDGSIKYQVSFPILLAYRYGIFSLFRFVVSAWHLRWIGDVPRRMNSCIDCGCDKSDYHVLKKWYIFILSMFWFMQMEHKIQKFYDKFFFARYFTSCKIVFQCMVQQATAIMIEHKFQNFYSYSHGLWNCTICYNGNSTITLWFIVMIHFTVARHIYMYIQEK